MTLERLKASLNDYACIAYNDEGLVYTSSQRGVGPLVELCELNTGLDELYVADKVIGKAAALLCVKCNVRMLYAKVASEAAVKILKEHGIDASYDELAEYIKDRTGKDKCPMEALAADTQSPEEMFMRAKQFVQNLKKA